MLNQEAFLTAADGEFLVFCALSKVVFFFFDGGPKP